MGSRHSQLMVKLRADTLRSNLQTEKSDADRQKESLQQGINWAQDRDVLHERVIPQEHHYESHNDNKSGEHENVVHGLLAITRLQNSLHFLYTSRKNNGI